MYNSVKDTAKPAFYAASAYASWIIIFNNVYQLHSDNSAVGSRAPYTDRVRYTIANCQICSDTLLACRSCIVLFFLSPGLVR